MVGLSHRICANNFIDFGFNVYRNGAIINELAKRGHNITVFSPDSDKNPPPGVHYILIEDQYTEEHREYVREMLASNETGNPIFEVLGHYAFCIEFCQGKKYMKISNG